MSALVSIITPTYGREHFLPQTWRWVAAQSYPNIEWLVLDDSPRAAEFLSNHEDRRIRYSHLAQRLTIGEKRNRLIAMARGEFVVHFDDDDYYAPNYVAGMVRELDRQGADFANLSAWYLYDVRHDFFGYWLLRHTLGLHYCCDAERVRVSHFTSENNASLAGNYRGYGFSYVYRRAITEFATFGAVNWCEEGPFVEAAAARFKLLHLNDHAQQVLHIMHSASSSSCFPQYHLPSFLLPALFEAPSGMILSMREGDRGVHGRFT